MPDPDWMARALAGVGHDRTATGWTGVLKLAPGHWLEVGADSVRLESYHSWRDDAPWTTRRDPRHVEAYRAVLEEAIHSRTPVAEAEWKHLLALRQSDVLSTMTLNVTWVSLGAQAILGVSITVVLVIVQLVVAVRISPVAVSYTHLDVYKRQLQHCSA